MSSNKTTIKLHHYLLVNLNTNHVYGTMLILAVGRYFVSYISIKDAPNLKLGVI
ncbi:MAG TPA: hypothetical protein PK978_06755 [Paludibacter sp.]|nr:hypothetical protein [Paludibacter sp.]